MTGTHQGYKFLSRSARTNLPCYCGLELRSKERVLRFRRPGETDARPHVVVISSVAVTEAVFNLVRRPDAFPAHSQIKGEVALKPEIILGVKVCLAEAIFRFRQTVSLVVAC